MQAEPHFFDDEEGQQPLPQEHGERELLTTPYDAPVRTLLQEIEDKTLIVNPKFQRKSVWSTTQKSRLIESLILNIPIPVVFLAEDEDGKRVVVDGQQRHRAIEEFKSGQYKLTGLEVLTRLNGSRWSDISPREARKIQSRTIRCIVISEKSDRDIRFQVFERLNTGVTPLTDQELRNCLYRGAFNDLLEELANEQQWLGLLRKKEPDNRFRHHELILRFFATSSVLANYRPPLKKLLDDYMAEHRHPTEEELNEYRNRFRVAVNRVSIVFNGRAFRRVKVSKSGGVFWDNSLNRAVFDVQMLCVRGYDDDRLREAAGAIVEGFENLCRTDDDFLDSITKATADRAKFYMRLRKFLGILVDVGIARHEEITALPQ